MRVCGRCGEQKKLEDFPTCSLTARLASQCICRACRTSYARDYRSRHPKKARAAEKRWRLKNPSKVRAMQARRTRTKEERRAANQMTAMVRRWHVTLFHTARTTSKKRGCAFDLEPEFILSLFEKQRGRCFWLGIEIVLSTCARDPQRPSLDRLDCSKGYTKDNVVLSSQFANMGRNKTTCERFREFLSSTGLA